MRGPAKAPSEIKVALVRPPILQLRRSLSAYGAVLPLGLAYIASVTRDQGYRLQVIDAPGEAIEQYRTVSSPVGPLSMNGLSPEEIVARLDSDVRVLGITHMFLHEWPTVRAIAERAKAAIADLVVVVGGENATAFHRWMLTQTDAVDYCVLGEGEATFIALLDRVRRGQSAADLPGIAARSLHNAAKHTARNASGSARPRDAVRKHKPLPQLSPRTKAIEQIPRPAWDLFPVQAYLSQADNHGVHRGRSFPILATRGCPYRCTFCSSPAMWTTTYLTRGPSEVVNEIRDYVERYAVDNINFCDLTAIIKKEWIVEFCELLQEAKLDITWQLPTGTRTEALDEQVLSLLYATGCRNITYAPESGSERMLRLLKKKVSLPRMLDGLRAAHRQTIVTRVNIIIGHPKERWSDTQHSLKWLIEAAWAGAEDAAVMIFAPYPGSADFDELYAQGKVDVDEELLYLALSRSGSSARTYNETMTTQQLLAAQLGMLAAFYSAAYLSRPRRFIEATKSLLTGRERTQLDQLLRTKLRQLRVHLATS